MKENYQMSKEELYEKLQASENGLTTGQMEASRKKYGWNEITEGKKKSSLVIFLEQFKDFLVIILIAAAVISMILGDIESSIVILVVITMNAILGTVQQINAEKSLQSLKQLSAPTAKVLRDGNTVVIPSKEVVVGDVVYLEAGDYICADGRIIDNASLQVNESALTGESLNIEKKDDVITDNVPLGDRLNMAYSGSFVTYGRASFLVTDIGMSTEVGKIAAMLKSASERKTPLQQNLDDFGRKLSILILAICAIIFGISIMQGETLMNAFMFAVALAVAAIPEALSSIVTIVLAFGTQKMAKEHAIIRKLQAVEGLGSVSIICSDKTGTLTQNKMTVKRYFLHQKEILTEDADITNIDQKRFVTYSVLCSDAKNEDGVEIGDPTEVALINLANELDPSVGDARDRHPRIGEIPFDSDRKLMSTVYNLHGKKVMITKGAVDVILERTKQIEVEEGIITITEEHKAVIQEENMKCSMSGLRVLAIAYRYVDDENVNLEDENEFIFQGLMAMMDPPREESKQAVAECKQAGIRPIMITGDHRITAAAIAKEIGILADESEAVEGAVLDSMTDEELRDYVPKISVYARVSPEHKIRIVRAWQERGNIVAMTGDGVNDAPALKQADVGVAMGIAGSEVAKDAASMVLTDDNFATIVKSVENGRNAYANIKKSIKFLLSGNTAGLLAVLYASIAGLPVPFAAVHLLFINLLTDSLPAIALGLDPHTSEVMEEKPRPKNESILTKDFLIGIGIEGLVIGAMTMIAFYIGLNAMGAKGASTMAFATLCLSRLVHGFNSKSDHPVLFTKAFNNNVFLWIAFFVGFVLLNAVLLVPFLRPVFSVKTLSLPLLLCVYGLSVANLFVIQFIKWLRKLIKS